MLLRIDNDFMEWFKANYETTEVSFKKAMEEYHEYLKTKEKVD